MVESLFSDDINPSDELYCIIRDEPRYARDKAWMEELWDTYQDYADKDFQKQLAQDFHARFWEMYLTCTLIFNSFKVVPKLTRSEGPDIEIDDSLRRIFLEAIAPSEGVSNNPDKVRRLEINTVKAMPVPEREILLRYSGAIAEKYKKYQIYLKQGIVSPSDCYIIALNSCKIETAIIDMTNTNDLPRIVKVVLPIADKVISVSSTQKVTVSYDYRPNISRSSGSLIPTNLFLVDKYSGLSGILYSDSDVVKHPNRAGHEFIFIHNPKSMQNAIPNEYFKLGIEYFVELGKINFSVYWKDWRNKI